MLNVRRRAQRTECDLLVVGGGVAGVYAAPLPTKGPIKTTASYPAQGGVAAAVGADDDSALHAEDTIAVGRVLSRPSAVSVLTTEAPARVADLGDLGVEFDPGLGLEGGHSRARVVHAGGAATGRQIAHALAERVVDH